MKKILICFLFMFTLCGCGTMLKTDNCIKEWGRKLENMNSYMATIAMSSLKGGSNVKHDIGVSYLNGNYKVSLKNNENNTLQVLLKNSDGVYVLTPALNKSFKFQSDWPTNSYHAYLPLSVYREVLNYEQNSVEKKDKFIITSKVNSKYNNALKVQKVFLNTKTLMIEEVIVYDDGMNVQIDCKYNAIDQKAKLSGDDFNLEKVSASARLLIGEGTANASLEYREPLYVVEGCTLSKAEESDEKCVYYYSGEKDYMIVQSITKESSVVSSNRIYNELIEINQGFAGKTDLSLNWYDLGMEYSIISSDLTNEEMISIANSLS